MTLVNTETGELIDVTYADVRTSIDTAKASLEHAAEQIVWQIENRAWAILGYADWNEMREAEYGGAAFMVPREDRPELLTRMRQSGLTNVEIAATAGVSEITVRRDLQSTNDDSAPVINTRGQVRPATYSKPDPAFLAKAAVDEFPELTFYVETARRDEAIRIATALRGYDRDEQGRRRELLRKTILAERRRETPLREISEDEQNAVRADVIFAATNTAARLIEVNGGADSIRGAVAYADQLELENWRDQFLSLARLCESLADACQPNLRRIK